MGMIVVGVLGQQAIEALPFFEGPPSSDRGWPLVLMGLFYAAFPAYILWSRRRQFPSSLIVDGPEGGIDQISVSA